MRPRQARSQPALGLPDRVVVRQIGVYPNRLYELLYELLLQAMRSAA